MASAAGVSVTSRQKRKHEDGGLDEPSAQTVAKKCRYCGCWSNSICPWDLTGTTLSMWAPNLPWARGKGTRPLGDKCKPCTIASHLEIVHCDGGKCFDVFFSWVLVWFRK